MWIRLWIRNTGKLVCQLFFFSLEESDLVPSSSASTTGLGGPLTVSTPAGTPPQLPTSPVSRAPQPPPTVSRVLPLPTSHAYSSSSTTTNTTDQNSLSSTTAAEYSRSWRHAKTRSEQRYVSAQLPRGARQQRRRVAEEAPTDTAAAVLVLDLQARRARHLKNLRKEIRKLEELEQKILLSQLAPAPTSPHQEEVESLSHINHTVGNDRMVSASLVPPSSPARKLTFVKKTTRVAARDPDGLWTAGSPDKTDHGVESIRNTASSSVGPPVLHTGGDSSDVTSFTSVTRSSVASSFAVESSGSNNRSGDSSRRAERRQVAASSSLHTETVQVGLDGICVQVDTGQVSGIHLVNLEKTIVVEGYGYGISCDMVT